ncbi:hypothetical protein ACFSLT_24960 [Novosphingobium resinovorum]
MRLAFAPTGLGRKRFQRAAALWLTGSFVPAFLSGTARAQDYPVEVPESVVEQTDAEGIRIGTMKVLPGSTSTCATTPTSITSAAR